MQGSKTHQKLSSLDTQHDFVVDSLMQQYNNNQNPSILILGAPTTKKNQSGVFNKTTNDPVWMEKPMGVKSHLSKQANKSIQYHEKWRENNTSGLKLRPVMLKNKPSLLTSKRYGSSIKKEEDRRPMT